MYQMRCTRPEVEAMCRRLSCIHPTICKLLGTDHGPTIDADARGPRRPGREARPRRLAASAWTSPTSTTRTSTSWPPHHVGGHLKVAPEHQSDAVLDADEEAATATFETFAGKFGRASERAGKEQYLVPYFIASHPGLAAWRR